VGLQSQIRIPDHFSSFLTIAEEWILGDLLVFLISHDTIFTKLGEMTDANKVMNPHF